MFKRPSDFFRNECPRSAFSVIHVLIIAEEIPAHELAGHLFNDPDYKVVRKDNADASRPLIEAGIFDLCVIPVRDERDLFDPSELPSSHPPLVLVVGAIGAELEQRLYAGGADLVLRGPLQSRGFHRACRHLVATTPSNSPVRQPQPETPVRLPVNSLEVLRDFSKILGYSLDPKLFTQHYVLKLREILSITRIAIFLEPAPGPAGTTAERHRHRLTCVASAGIPTELLDCIELSRTGGLGHHVIKRGQILRLETLPGFASADMAKMQREFDVLGCQVALPVNDREHTLGVAVIGGRVTGTPFADSELQLVYHLLEELAVALKNSRLHHQLAASHNLLSDVLGALTSGSLVVSADLAILHANPAFTQFLRGTSHAAPAPVDFAELPPPLARAIHDLAEKGQPAEPFFLDSPAASSRSYRASLIPLHGPDQTLPQPVLAIIEDFTQIQAAQRAEIAASNHQLLALIARRFAHEIRNSLVPLTTHHQLFDSDYASGEFRDSLKASLGRETARIQRFTEQMLFLSQPPYPADGILPVRPLLQTAFERACRSIGLSAEFVITGEDGELSVRAHRASLSHALEEILCNALQATVGATVEAPIRVDLRLISPAGAPPRLLVGFSDPGPGFTKDIAARATEPFFTTRNTGVGLGLTVARRIVEHHSGVLEIHPDTKPGANHLSVQLPLA